MNSSTITTSAERFLRKGSKIYIEGQLRTRKWQDKDGHDRYTTEISVGVGGVLTMLDSAPGAGGAGGGGQRSGGYNDGGSGGGSGGGSRGGGSGGGWNKGGDTGGGSSGGGGFSDDLDDDIPF